MKSIICPECGYECLDCQSIAHESWFWIGDLERDGVVIRVTGDARKYVSQQIIVTNPDDKGTYLCSGWVGVKTGKRFRHKHRTLLGSLFCDLDSLVLRLRGIVK